MSHAKTLVASYFLFFFRALVYSIYSSVAFLAFVNGNIIDRDEFGLLLLTYPLVNYGVQVSSGPLADYYGQKILSCVSWICFALGMLLAKNAWGQHSFGLLMAAAICMGTGTGLFSPAFWGVLAHNTNEKHVSLFFALPFFVTWPIGFYLYKYTHDASLINIFIVLGIIVSVIGFFISILGIPKRKRPEKSFFSFYVNAVKTWNCKPLLLYLLLSVPMLCLASEIFRIIQYFQNTWVIGPEVLSQIDYLTRKNSFFIDHFISGNNISFTSVIEIVYAALLIPVSIAGKPQNRHKRLIIAISLFCVGALFCFTSPSWITFLVGCVVIAIADSIFTPTNMEYILKTAPKDLKSTWAAYRMLPLYAAQLIMVTPMVNNMFYSDNYTADRASAWEDAQPWKITILLLIMGGIAIFCLYKHMRAFSGYTPDNQDSPDDFEHPCVPDEPVNVDEFKPFEE